jgi:hypothetical protein
MLHDPLGWHFPATRGEAVPPATATIEAIGLLIRYEASMRATSTSSDQRTIVWIFDRIIPEFLSSHLASWRTRSSNVERASHKETSTMPDSQTIKAQDDLLEDQLKAIVANKQLAELAFPGAEVREKIVPLFRRFRRIAEEKDES